MSLPNSFDLSDAAGTVLLLEPAGVDTRPFALSLDGEEAVAPVSSARYTAKSGARSAGAWTFEYQLLDRPTLQFLKDFFDTYSGRAGKRNTDGTSSGFFFPTWQWEMEVVDNNGSNSISIQNIGYAGDVFPQGGNYRWLLIVCGSAYVAHQVTAAALSGGLDVLTVNTLNTVGSMPSLPWTRVKGCRPLWLRYGVFDTEEFTYTQRSDDRFDVTLTIRELPDEAPGS